MRAVPAFDFWLALIAGHGVWSEGQFRAGPRERVAAASALMGTVGCVIAVWAAIMLRQPEKSWSDPDTRAVVLILVAVAGTLAAAVLVVHYQRIVRGYPVGAARFWPSLIWRGAAFFVLVGAVTACFSSAHVAAGTVVGLLAGADVTLTLWALGTAPNVLALARQFLLSPLHLGVVGALLAALITHTGGSTLSLIGLYLGVWAAFGSALLAMKLLETLALHFERQYEAHRIDVAARERAHRAHWLHDDVLSEVRLASLRITNGSASPEQINAELLDLDHRLRLRQLEEMIRDGTPPIYEILQPHLRRAQNLGVRLVGVPTHEVTGVTVTEPDAVLLNRVLSLLISNAVNAGATQLGVGLRVPTDSIEVSITDNAGGFSLDSLPEGRGLHRLMMELGPGSVERRDAPSGSTMIVRLPRSLPCDGAGAEPLPAEHRMPRPTLRAVP